MAPKQPTTTPAPPRERMIRAAAELLVAGGRAAASTRAVSAAAGVQAPAIYRQFGDLDGLLRTAAREVMRDYVRTKALRTPLADPLEDLRRGFDQHVAFGLAHPAIFAILTTAIDDDDDDDPAHTGQAILHGLVERLARAGLLRVSVDHAVALIHAAGAGATLALIGTPEEERDLRVATDLRDATLAAITIPHSTTAATTPTTASTVAARAIALQAVLADADNAVLTASERRLLDEWLTRLS